jgi:hypothetical protein
VPRGHETRTAPAAGVSRSLIVPLARKLDAIFEKYVPRATEIQLDRWRKRALAHKLKDNFFYLLNELL